MNAEDQFVFDVVHSAGGTVGSRAELMSLTFLATEQTGSPFEFTSGVYGPYCSEVIYATCRLDVAGLLRFPHSVVNSESVSVHELTRAGVDREPRRVLSCVKCLSNLSRRELFEYVEDRHPEYFESFNSPVWYSSPSQRRPVQGRRD